MSSNTDILDTISVSAGSTSPNISPQSSGTFRRPTFPKFNIPPRECQALTLVNQISQPSDATLVTATDDMSVATTDTKKCISNDFISHCVRPVVKSTWTDEQKAANVKLFNFDANPVIFGDDRVGEVFVGGAASRSVPEILYKVGIRGIINTSVELIESLDSNLPLSITINEDKNVIYDHFTSYDDSLTDKIVVKCIPLKDDAASDNDLKSSIEECIKFIDHIRNAGYSVLIHCQMGRSRSVSIAMAYMMAKQARKYIKSEQDAPAQLTFYSKALERVQTYRHQKACPNMSFAFVLYGYDEELRQKVTDHYKKTKTETDV
jgi:hypothetical protein